MHLPATDTNLLSFEQDPVHFPVFSIKFIFFAHEVQKSGVVEHVPQFGSQGLHTFSLLS